MRRAFSLRRVFHSRAGLWPVFIFNLLIQRIILTFISAVISLAQGDTFIN